jgi:hypothetical protein
MISNTWISHLLYINWYTKMSLLGHHVCIACRHRHFEFYRKQAWYYSGQHSRDRDHMVVGVTQLPMKSVPITTKVAISNPAHAKVYLIQHYVIKCVSDLWQVGGFLRVVQFPPPIKLSHDILNWNSGVRWKWY